MKLRFPKPYIVFFLVFAVVISQNGSADSDPGPLDTDPFILINELSKLGLFKTNDKIWDFHGQMTYISSSKPAFPAAYTNLGGTPHSLLPETERSFSGTVTFYAGLKAWQGGEIYYAPEMISSHPLSGLKGLGGSIQNGELQKNGTESATWYTSRFYLRQTFNFGGHSHPIESYPMQLAENLDSRRLVITVGNMSILDIFDKNAYSGDIRQQFFNMAFMTHAAYDFAADARGFTVGAAAEYYFDDWAFRFGHFAPPIEANGKHLDFRLFKYYGDQAELEHRHIIVGRPGAVRILGFRNYEWMGSFNDAIAAYQSNPALNAANCITYNYDSTNANAPDLCWARKNNVKMGIGLNLEQSLTKDIGVFLRGMYSDGKTEVYSYTSADRSLSMGTLIDGELWHRTKDAIGVGYAISWISTSHAAYLNLGGVDGFIGDGKINNSPEQVVDIFYKLNLIRSVWITADYQHIANPAYNADRGPVDVYGVRAHFEF
jgi:high affinity Mn2+ porin